MFDKELYPDCASEEPALTSDEWISGKTSDPKTRNILEKGDTGPRKLVAKKSEIIDMATVWKNKCFVLEEENKELKALVAKLQS